MGLEISAAAGRGPETPRASGPIGEPLAGASLFSHLIPDHGRHQPPEFACHFLGDPFASWTYMFFVILWLLMAWPGPWWPVGSGQEEGPQVAGCQSNCGPEKDLKSWSG